jgi:hypothetical protein
MADIPASTPIVTPAVPAQTYPLWIVESLSFTGDGITSPLTAQAFFRCARRDASQPTGWVLGDEHVNYYIPDVYAVAATDADVASTITQLTATKSKGIKDYTLESPEVLAGLKAAFGGNPTEGERDILLSVQGIGSKSKEERAFIMKDAFKVLKSSRERQNKRLNEITQGLYRETSPAPVGGLD